MRAFVVVVAVVLAVVLTSALIPRRAHIFDVPEVLSTFRQAGIVLRTQPFDPRKALEVLSTPRQDVVVVVYRRVKAGETGPWQLASSTRRARRDNVFAAWTERGAAVRLSLSRLDDYSASGIGVPEVVTIVLHPGQSRTLARATAPNGAEVQCVRGGAIAQHFVDFARFKPGWLNGSYTRDEHIQLHWGPQMPGRSFVLTCRNRPSS